MAADVFSLVSDFGDSCGNGRGRCHSQAIHCLFRLHISGLDLRLNFRRICLGRFDLIWLVLWICDVIAIIWFSAPALFVVLVVNFTKGLCIKQDQPDLRCNEIRRDTSVEGNRSAHHC